MQAIREARQQFLPNKSKNRGRILQSRYRILIMIPKSKKNIMVIYHNDVCILKEKLTHLTSDLKKMTTTEQVQYRKNRIIQTLLELGINISKLDAIAASGGLIRPLEGG